MCCASNIFSLFGSVRRACAASAVSKAATGLTAWRASSRLRKSSGVFRNEGSPFFFWLIVPVPPSPWARYPRSAPLVPFALLRRARPPPQRSCAVAANCSSRSACGTNVLTTAARPSFAAITFAKLGLHKTDDKGALKEQEQQKTKTYKTALSFLPKDHVFVSPKLKT